MIYSVTGWFKITEYNNKREILIGNLVETTCLYTYPSPTEITYDQGKQFIGHEFRKYLIGMEYMITYKSRTLGNPPPNEILE